MKHLAYVIPNHNATWVNLPKTASRSILAVLKESYGPVHSVQRVPEDIGLVFTIVRNPYARCLSLWWSTCRQGEDRYGFKKAGKTPAHLVVWLMKLPEKHKKFDLNYTQMELLEMAGRPRTTEIIQYENLEEGFRHLPFVDDGQPIPVRNRKANGRPPADYTPEFIRAVNDWCADDFEKLGYTKLEPHNG